MKGDFFQNSFFQNWPAKILSLLAALLLFLFYQVSILEKRQLEIPLNLIISETLTAASPVPETVTVTIRGEEEELFRISESDIEVYCDFSEYSREGRYRAPVRFIKRGTARKIEDLEILVDPMEIRLDLQESTRQRIKIQPNLSGYPEEGFELEQYYLTPDTVLVQGPRKHLQKLDFILTESIEISGKTGDFSQRVLLKTTDPFLTFPEGRSVEFYGIVNETVLIRTFEGADIVLLDLAPEWEIPRSLPRGRLKVRGSGGSLKDIRPEQLTLTADCSGVDEAGTYRLALTPLVPTGLKVIDYQPQSIEFSVIKKTAGE